MGEKVKGSIRHAWDLTAGSVPRLFLHTNAAVVEVFTHIYSSLSCIKLDVFPSYPDQVDKFPSFPILGKILLTHITGERFCLPF